MLVIPSKIIQESSVAEPDGNENREAVSLVEDNQHSGFLDDSSRSLIKAIGTIENGKTLHYYSYGNFNLVRLILHLLKQTGPVHLFMTSYSISQESIAQLQRRLELQELLSLRLIIDNRVKSMSPKPFQMLAQCFNYRCSSIHAKVALLWNENWTISIITSQNATNNPKMERGSIFTSPEVFQFDLNALENEFNRSAT
jgi:hypothetical protein